MPSTQKTRLDARTAMRIASVEATIGFITAPAHLSRILDGAARKDMSVSQMNKSARIDAAGFALGEELRHISAFSARYIEQVLKCKGQIAEVPDPPALGAEEYGWNFLNAAGKAERSNSLAVDFPLSTVQREGRNTTPITNSLAAFDWDDLDLARAALIPGFQLPREKAMRAVRMIAEDIDEMMYIGDSDRGINGLLNQTTIVQANENAAAVLSGLSAQALYDFFADHFDAYLTTFGDADEGLTWKCLLPKDEALRLGRTKNADDRSITVEQELVNAYSKHGFTGFSYNRFCDTAGTGATKMLCIYPDTDGLAVGRVVSTEYTEAEPQRVAFSTKIHAFGRSGGVAFRQPEKVRYGYTL